MDLSSILPLLFAGKNPDMANILSALNNKKTDGGNNNDILASILANRGKDGKKESDTKNENSSADEKTKLLSGLMGGNAGQAEMLMSLMNTMNKPKTDNRPIGLSVIQNLAPNDILGILLKYYNRKL